jgi:hypothetical protein
MAKVLYLNPIKWRKGITPIWIATHFALLKSKLHKVIFGIKKANHFNSIIKIDESILINKSIGEKLIKLCRSDFGLF